MAGRVFYLATGSQYLLLDGTRAMTGNLDMGTNDITNVGTVDGVDVSAHASRHISGGADEIDGDVLDIDWNPSNYTPATTPTEVSSVDHLTAHLYGIDQALGTSADEKVKVSADDTTPDYLLSKLTAGNAISLTETSGGGDESVTIAVTEANIDHGSLSGKNDDDHTQYLLVNGNRAMSGSLTINAGFCTLDNAGPAFFVMDRGSNTDNAGFRWATNGTDVWDLRLSSGGSESLYLRRFGGVGTANIVEFRHSGSGIRVHEAILMQTEDITGVADLQATTATIDNGTGTSLDLGAGSATTPALTMGDVDTGVYSGGTDIVAIATGGVEAARFDASQNLTVASEGTAASPAVEVGGTGSGNGLYEHSGLYTAVSQGGTLRQWWQGSISFFSCSVRPNGTRDLGGSPAPWNSIYGDTVYIGGDNGGVSGFVGLTGTTGIGDGTSKDMTAPAIGTGSGPDYGGSPYVVQKWIKIYDDDGTTALWLPAF